MIRAVFFDWFNTLAHYDPPRYELHRRACGELGFEVSPEDTRRGVLAADRFYFDENIKAPIEQRDRDAQQAVWLRYQEIVLAEAGVPVSPEQVLQIMGRVHQLFKGDSWALFDDVLPAMFALRENGLTMGLLTNASRGLVSVYAELGLGPYLDFVVTSEEAGGDKPQPPIFLMALEQAGVEPAEAYHVGDQYNIDIAGARGVGIGPVLIDRYEQYPDVTDCPRIQDLGELVSLL
jgi:putative hydrolase of the HAD superfamily